MTNVEGLESAYVKFMNYAHQLGTLNEKEKNDEWRKFHLLYKGSKQGDTNHSDDGKNVITTILV